MQNLDYDMLRKDSFVFRRHQCLYFPFSTVVILQYEEESIMHRNKFKYQEAYYFANLAGYRN